MTYDVLIRHTHHVPTGSGEVHWFEWKSAEARSEEEAFLAQSLFNCWDGVSAIHATQPDERVCYSVDTGIPMFPTDNARRPRHSVSSDEMRCG
ncbi:MAG: hypothetical protein ABT940_08570 [Alphaproteobacteria bacterium]